MAPWAWVALLGDDHGDTTAPRKRKPTTPMNLIELPDEITHAIFTYVANSPSRIGPCLCHILRPLSMKWRKELDAKRELWELAKHDLLFDYYKSDRSKETPTNSRTHATTQKGRPSKRPRKHQSAPPCPSDDSKRPRERRSGPPRRSGRLRPATPKEQFIHSYNLLLSRTESALLELTERAHSSKNRLSLTALKRLLKEYEPIAINRRVRTGGTFLVEVVRARHVGESVVLNCARLLIEQEGADPNVPSAEAVTSSTTTVAPVQKRCAASGEVGSCLTSSSGRELYPLVIAAARGMSTVVKYLLGAGADPGARGSSRFRLYSNPRKTVKGVDLTALDFATQMRDNEIQHGVRGEDLRGLLKVISMLENGVT